MCFRLGEEYTYYTFSRDEPKVNSVPQQCPIKVEFETNHSVEVEDRLSGRRFPMMFSVWKITIGPFDKLINGILTIGDRELVFSTFRSKDVE